MRGSSALVLLLLLGGCLDWEGYSRNLGNDLAIGAELGVLDLAGDATAPPDAAGVWCAANLVANGAFKTDTSAWMGTATDAPPTWQAPGHDTPGALTACGGGLYSVFVQVPVNAPAGAVFQLQLWLSSDSTSPPDTTTLVSEVGFMDAMATSGTLKPAWVEVTAPFQLNNPGAGKLEIRVQAMGSNGGSSCFQLDDVCLLRQ